MFKKMLRAFGIGGPTVDTVLTEPHVFPGATLAGEVRITGGDGEVDIERVTLRFEAKAELERGDEQHDATVEFLHVVVAESFRFEAEEHKVIPFAVPIPWETPINVVDGQQLPGVLLGVRTELAVARGVDKGDLDGLFVAPLPSQSRVLDAFGALGFQFKSTDLEIAQLYGVDQQLPMFQEIEFFPPPQYQERINEVELTFVADPEGVHVVLEADKRGGLFRSGQDEFGRFRRTHAEAEQADWTSDLTRWLDEVAQRGGLFGGGHPEHGHHEEHHGGGPGWGGVAAGAALGVGAGLVGGVVAGEVIDEVGDFFEGEED
ncbi:sporulation protein [Saccharopolyspora sp. MS10]|uniref:sporulation protein n=1 Tax=Saccharopolyspora sp. MS10 TaxID=3385973 RepID=UPI0039A34162